MNISRLIKMATVPSDTMLRRGWEGRLSMGTEKGPSHQHAPERDTLSFP